MAVDLRLARPDQVEVRALEDEDAGHDRPPGPGRRPAPASPPRLARRAPPGRPTGPRSRRPSAGPSGAPRRRASCRSPERAEHRVERVGERRRRQSELRSAAPRSGPPDPAASRRAPTPIRDRRPQPDRDRLAMEQFAEAAGRLDRVAERVAEVERDPPGRRALLPLVGRRRRRPSPRPPARRPRRRRPSRTPRRRRGRSPRRRPRGARTAARRRAPPSSPPRRAPPAAAARAASGGTRCR